MSYNPNQSRFIPREYEEHDDYAPEPVLVDIPEGPSGPGHVSWYRAPSPYQYQSEYRRVGTANTDVRTNDRVVGNLGSCVHNQEIVSILNSIQGLRKEKSIVLMTRTTHHAYQTRAATARSVERTRELDAINQDIARLQARGRDLLVSCGFNERSIPALVSSFGTKNTKIRKRSKVLQILRLLGFI